MARPYVLINVAASVDGKIDTFERHGAAISSEPDRERVDRLRADVDAIMVGGRTLLGEDPRLTVRSPELRAARVARGESENPTKVAIVSRPSLGSGARFLTHGPARVVVFTPTTIPRSDTQWLRDRGVLCFAHGAGRVDLPRALETLAGLGIGRVLVEGGATLNFELLRLALVDELQVYVAPLIFGGASAPTLAGGDGLARDQALPLRRVSVESFADGGLLLRYALTRPES